MGRFHAKLSGVSNPQSVLYFDEPTTSYIPEDLAPWKELVNDGTFSKASLERTPSSFVAGAHPVWAEALSKSAAKHGWTSLHHLHLAFEAAERYDVPTARKHLNASLELGHNSAQALRARRDGSRHALSVTLYAAAWEASKAVPASDPSRVPPQTEPRGRAHLHPAKARDRSEPPKSASEAAWEELVAASPSLTAFTLRATRPLRATSSVSRAASALHRADADGVLAELKSHTYAHYPHGLRKELTNLWFDALYMKAESTKGRKLSAIERKAIMFDLATRRRLTSE